MKLLYGTTNQAKIDSMKAILKGLDIEIIGANELGINIDVEESGKTPLENARIKATAYYQATGIPTFSCDSGLYIDGIDDDRQPGVHVRRVNGKYLDDAAFIEYYSNLVSEIGNEVKAKFKNAISLVLNDDQIIEYDGDDLADHFIMTSKAHKDRVFGFPMNSIGIDIRSKKYFVEVKEKDKKELESTNGFFNFFNRLLNK